jgi:hypothetical protein
LSACPLRAAGSSALHRPERRAAVYIGIGTIILIIILVILLT